MSFSRGMAFKCITKRFLRGPCSLCENVSARYELIPKSHETGTRIFMEQALVISEDPTVDNGLRVVSRRRLQLV
ncbi:hypothetical protein K0M31_013894 [Melipona bicolor]|uniref:Uncharacterized protein n=1 Tax=Melipona bicolor TaxID=60889 RepID=A0AA40KTS1_9HYME|nr:hypothetical protein K0M31_013894 [Melipona bicolor]